MKNGKTGQIEKENVQQKLRPARDKEIKNLKNTHFWKVNEKRNGNFLLKRREKKQQQQF